MTEPSLNTTFDTSLVDLSQKYHKDQNSSFSTTESATSEDYKQSITNPKADILTPTTNSTKFAEQPKKEKMPTRYLPTVDAYDKWASVYDTDGNILQAIDDLELQTLLPEFIKLVSASATPKKTLEIVDLGCGTGRNTIKLIEAAWPEDTNVRITGIDASKGMLSLAKEKITKSLSTLPPNSLSKRSSAFLHHNFLNEVDPTGSPVLLPSSSRYHALISTLVLEHFPLAPFFQALSSLLVPGGLALVTNMHPEMGAQSQAGFVGTDEEGRSVKVRGCSWVHGVEETVEAARGIGFEVVGKVSERGVSKEMIREGVLGERGRKWVDVMVWYGIILQKAG